MTRLQEHHMMLSTIERGFARHSVALAGDYPTSFFGLKMELVTVTYLPNVGLFTDETSSGSLSLDPSMTLFHALLPHRARHHLKRLFCRLVRHQAEPASVDTLCDHFVHCVPPSAFLWILLLAYASLVLVAASHSLIQPMSILTTSCP